MRSSISILRSVGTKVGTLCRPSRAQHSHTTMSGAKALLKLASFWREFVIPEKYAQGESLAMKFIARLHGGRAIWYIEGMKLPGAVLFDLDDTILHGEAVGDECWLETCRNAIRENPLLSHLRLEGLYQEVQQARQWFWSCEDRHQHGRLRLLESRTEIAAIALRKLRIEGAEKVARAFAESFHSIYYDRLRPFPNAMETLRWFRERNVPMGLITNGTSQGQRKKIDKFSLDHLFDLIMIEEEFGVGKPSMKVFEHAVKTLNVTPSETWMVGDRLDWDVQAPQALGIHGVWNDFRRKGLPSGSACRPDRIVHSIAELAGLA